jgi:prefoldin subunit 5
MALIDDLKKKTEEGLKTLKETAQDLAFNVEKQAKIGKKKYVDMTKIQRNMQKLYMEIGQYVYDELSAEKAINRTDSYIKERMSAIARMSLEIKDIEDEIYEIEKTLPPTHDQT